LSSGLFALQRSSVWKPRGACPILESCACVCPVAKVLGLLKEQEFFDYVRRDAAKASAVSGHADLNPEEAELDKGYREISEAKATSGGAAWL
jgi:hypothetical protein